tara:strand:- start:525 stop:1184 length:660 start_codon:yes stop_codon:yes gene_type:complete
MLLNPNAVGKDQQLEGISTDVFDQPIPGQSLTGAPNSYAWEKPAKFTTIDDSLSYVMDKLKNNPRTQKSYDEVITMGMPIESIVNTITFGGFIEGLWSVDVAELLKPPLMGFLMLYADDKDLPFVAFNNNESSLKTAADDMDNFDFMAAVKENNPTAHSNLEVALQEAGKNNLQKMIEQEDRQNSFLVEGPQIEEMAMIEPMSMEEEMQQPTMSEEEII